MKVESDFIDIGSVKNPRLTIKLTKSELKELLDYNACSHRKIVDRFLDFPLIVEVTKYKGSLIEDE